MSPSSGGRVRRPSRAALVCTLVLAAISWAAASAPASHAATAWDPSLTRYPYLTDATAASVQVTWADTWVNTYGAITWGPSPGTCADHTLRPSRLGTKFSVSGVSEYQHSAAITGLSPGQAYCYRVRGGAGTSIDLLGAQQSPTFHTLPAAGDFTFLVFGDWGDTRSGYNAAQAALDAQIAGAARAGALFAVGTGDIAYSTGTPTQYGDLVRSGTGVSSVFGPDYWRDPGSLLPFFSTPGNHGRTNTFFQTWPEPATVAASGGTYQTTSFPSIDGNVSSTGPSGWYAFSVGSARFYVLTADWSDTNVGTADGSLCGKQFPGGTCPDYQVEADAEWASDSPELAWLRNDLRSHPGGLKFGFFHYPLRSDDATEPDDPYLENRPDNPHGPDALEAVLRTGGVQLAFNGHAHIYQRNVAPPDGVISYVTGGGGARLVTIAKGSRRYCSPTDAYGLGWSTTAAKGASCGAATTPTSLLQVHHFLKVTVSGSRVTVAPTNANGDTFDVQTYDFGPDTTSPVAPPGVAAAYVAATTTRAGYANVAWGASPSSDVSDYDVYRRDPGDPTAGYVATVPPNTTSYHDSGAAPGVGYVYGVRARDLAGNVSAMATTAPLSGTDTTAPSSPGNLAATATSSSEIDLSWTASSDNVGVTAYRLYRGGSLLATLPGSATGYADTGLAPSTTYAYGLSAVDLAGNVSAQASGGATTRGSATSTQLLFTPTADATVALSQPDANLGSSSRLIADASPVEDALLRFDVAGTTSCRISSAKLRLTVGTSRDDYSRLGGSFYGTDGTSWSESTVTWNTAPARSGPAVASLGAVTAGTAYLVDVTGLVSGDGPVTIRLATTSGDAVRYFSKEGGAPGTVPQLQVVCA